MASTSLPLFHLAIFLPFLTLLYVAGKIIYNIWFHPLAKFDGPLLAKISNAWYGLSWSGGRYVHDIAALHEKYGDIVRTAPGELSFGSVESYKEIYGHATKDRRPFLKTVWYDVPDNTGPTGIASERDPQKHAAIRKSLSHGFSAKALRLQTDVVNQYIDLFISQLHKFGTVEKGVPIQEWYNWLTFDIIGNLAFGEDFGAVAEAKPNFWISTIIDGSHANTMKDIIFNRLPLLRPLEPYIMRDLNRVRKAFVDLSLQKSRSRMAQENSRDDFFSHILSEKGSQVTEGYLCVQAQTLITAGSETTATTLATLSYYLSKNPEAMARLKKEVRSTFKNSLEIDSDSTAHLPYLCAVIEEGLRIYNPAAFGLPRICPGAEINGVFVPAGTIVHTSPWQTQHAKKYWYEPDGFHPERWLGAEHEYHDAVFDGDLKNASQPFSIGPRACIGKNLAYMEMRIILAKLVWHFDMELVSKDIDWNRDTRFYTLWKKPDLMVRFHPVA